MNIKKIQKNKKGQAVNSRLKTMKSEEAMIAGILEGPPDVLDQQSQLLRQYL